MNTSNLKWILHGVVSFRDAFALVPWVKYSSEKPNKMSVMFVVAVRWLWLQIFIHCMRYVNNLCFAWKCFEKTFGSHVVYSGNSCVFVRFGLFSTLHSRRVIMCMLLCISDYFFCFFLSVSHSVRIIMSDNSFLCKSAARTFVHTNILMRQSSSSGSNLQTLGFCENLNLKLHTHTQFSMICGDFLHSSSWTITITDYITNRLDVSCHEYECDGTWFAHRYLELNKFRKFSWITDEIVASSTLQFAKWNYMLWPWNCIEQFLRSWTFNSFDRNDFNGQ